LGGFFSQAYAINSHRQVVGGATTVANITHGFLWDGSMHDLGTLPNGAFSWAHAVNDSGQAAGVAGLPSGAYHAVLWTGCAIQDLGSLDANSTSEAFGINNNGQVVGTCNPNHVSRAFLFSAGARRALNPLIPAGSGWVLELAQSINDTG